MIKKVLKKYTVALVVPSRGVTKEELSKAMKKLKKLGMGKVWFRKNILERKLGYWSGDIFERVYELQKSFEDPTIDIIWCLKGGLTSLELIPFLDFNKIKNNKKLFIGFSDITSLQQAFLSYSGMESVQFHMPGSKYWFNNKQELRFLKKIVEGEDYCIKINDENIYKHSREKVSGTLIGGCLDLLCSTLGTKHEIDTDNKILYLEDTNCTPQRLYNDLCHLFIAGKFDNIKGLIISEMENCGKYKHFFGLFLRKLNNKNIPIIKELKSGHTKEKVPIILGGKCEIDTSKKEIIFGFSDKAKKEMNLGVRK